MIAGLVDFLFGTSRHLNFITRFNTRIRTYDEVVSAHSYYVAVYTYIIGKMMQYEGQEIDVNKAVTRALFHDLEECTAGDILTPFKKRFEKEYNHLCTTVVLEILRSLEESVKANIFSHWQNAKQDKEGQLVDFSDDLAGFIYCIEQIKSGNKTFYVIADDYLGRLKNAGEKNDFLKRIVDKIRERSGYET